MVEDPKVRIQDIKVGGGPEVEPNDTVLILYKVATTKNKLIGGELLESTYAPDIPIEITYSKERLLEGIFEGMRGMRISGSIRMLEIPTELAFGNVAYRKVPAGSPLFVEITLIAIISRSA